MSRQLIKLGSGQIFIHVKRTVGRNCDKRQVDISRLGTGEFLLGLLRRFLQPLKSHLVCSEIYAVFFGEIICQIVEDDFIEVIAAQARISVGSQYFEYSVAQFEDGYVESTSAQVVYQNLVRSFFFVETIGQRSRRRFVDYSLYVKSRNLAGVFSRLLLSVREVCRYCDYSLRHLFSQIAFSVVLQFCEDHR